MKIVKTSSDGKVEGFSFRVTGANGYDQTFVTDKNGEIFIEGLRIGEYVISEVSDNASAGYIALDEGGTFTAQGYIRNNGNSFDEEYDEINIPDEYKVFSMPKSEKAHKEIQKQKTHHSHDER